LIKLDKSINFWQNFIAPMTVMLHFEGALNNIEKIKKLLEDAPLLKLAVEYDNFK